MTVYTALTPDPIDAQSIVVRIASDACGAAVVFEGRTRSPDGGRDISCLRYEAFEERAERQLHAFASEIASRPRIHGVAAVHRVGDVSVGEPSVIVAVVAEHRDEAFAGARDLIDRIKAEAAIWKKEISSDGEAWVGVPA